MRQNHPGFASYLVSVVMPAVLGRLTEQLRLQREDVVEHAIDAPALQSMVRDHAGALEIFAQGRSKRSVDPRLPSHLGLFEPLKAAVDRKLPRPMALALHVMPYRVPRPAPPA